LFAVGSGKPSVFNGIFLSSILVVRKPISIGGEPSAVGPTDPQSIKLKSQGGTLLRSQLPQKFIHEASVILNLRVR